MNYTINLNQEFNSIEVSFDGVPDKAIREALKGLKFRWHNIKKVWYGYADQTKIEAILNGQPIEVEAKPKANKYGVKVGDVFHASWGYDQTQNNFFQVVELVGSCSVRVVEVYPDYEVEWATGMAEDRKVRIEESAMLPRAGRSIFIKDQEKGDLHRIGSWSDKPEDIYIRIDSVATARPFKGGTVYESWYA